MSYDIKRSQSTPFYVVYHEGKRLDELGSFTSTAEALSAIETHSKLPKEEAAPVEKKETPRAKATSGS